MPLSPLPAQTGASDASTERDPGWIELRSAGSALPGAPLTTGEAALIAKVSQQTIIRAVTSGELKGHRVPSSSHRRIDPREFAAYLEREKIPGTIPPTEILVLGRIEALRGELEAMLKEVEEAARIRVTEDSFAAGMLVSEAQPRLLALDRSVDPRKFESLCAHLKSRDDVKVPARQSTKRGERLLWTPDGRVSTRVELADGNSQVLASVERFVRRRLGTVVGARED